MLIVEDDLDFRNRLRDYISSRGCSVSTAEDGEQAIDRLLFYKPNLMILDMLLPKLDGFAVLEKIRSYPDPVIAATPVIILSNLSGEKDIERASEFNVAAYFIKASATFEEVLQKALEVIFNGNPPPSTHIEELENYS